MPSPFHPQLPLRLRQEVSTFVGEAGARRVIPPVFRLGLPGGRRGVDQVAVPEEKGLTPSMRADLVEGCLHALATRPVPAPWLTRGGQLVITDVDTAWSAACRVAYGRLGLPFPGFWVVTRFGWVDMVAVVAVPVRVRSRRPHSRS